MTAVVRNRGQASRKPVDKEKSVETTILEESEFVPHEESGRLSSVSFSTRSASDLFSDESDYATREESDTTVDDDDADTMDGRPPGARIASKRRGLLPGEKHVGVTLDGLRVFSIPKTPSQWEGLTSMWYAPRSLLAWCGWAVSLAVFLAFPEQPMYMVALAVFWRLMCNVGLGFLLKIQSNSFYLTVWIHRLRARPFSSMNSMVSTLLSSTMYQARDILRDATLPDNFPAWILFRNVVDVVETNEVVAFTLMSLRFAIISRQELVLNSSAITNLVDFTGVILIGLSIYSKLAAHRATGDYTWYWGDFFFLRTGAAALSYDGVFELFPHPMYTVGYGWTYGCAILARSFTVLACCMTFHLMQLLFLSLVEIPHVDKTYGRSSRVIKYKNGDNAVVTARVPPGVPEDIHGEPTIAALVSGSSNLLVIKNFDLFRASDVNLALMLVFFVLGNWMASRKSGPMDDDSYFIFQAIFWHAVSTVVKATILLRQEKTKFWTKHHIARGRTVLNAFESWKRLYNMLHSLQYISFIMCAIRLGGFPQISKMLDPSYVSQLVLGNMLVIVSLWSFSSCYEVLGDYGWFYGDFFLTLKKSGEPSLPTYQGIYRYLNNPDAYLGHLWMYGVAIIGGSMELAVVSIISHSMKIAFLQAVEKPHFRQVYKQHVRKSSTALGRAIQTKVSDIKRNETAMFLSNWIKHPIETGALAPSSEQLAIAMTDTMNLGDNSVAVELGPGTGPFTKRILKLQAEKKNATYLAFELSPEFHQRLCEMFPEHKTSFLLESAENIIKALKARGHNHADSVISGLPWAIFPTQLQEAILKKVYDALPVGGRFCTFAYLQGLVMPAGQNFKLLLEKTFGKGNVTRSDIVWKNLPPAFVYRCEKTA